MGSYIRPQFDNYLDVRNCVHPLLDYNSQVLPVPNDVVSIFLLITQNEFLQIFKNVVGRSFFESLFYMIFSMQVQNITLL